MTEMTEERRYEHDCDACVFLGHGAAHGREADLWVCPQEIGGAALIARWSSRDDNYSSMPASMISTFKRCGSQTSALYVEIARRAKERGIL